MFDEPKIAQEMNALIAERRFKDMIELGEQIINDHPDNYLGRWWIARAYTLMGDTEAALDWFMEAMKKADDEFEESKISSSIANVYNIRKDWRESLNYTDIALELNPENVVAIIARGIALMASGKRKEANKLLVQNMSLFKDDYQKACVAAVKRDKKKMLEHLTKAIKQNPHNRITVLHDPDFSLYTRDPEFRSLLKA
jgi:tetratricopeptide (TPR) repeat protein